MNPLKPVEFRGTSLTDLRRFPTDARREAGHQIDLLQHGGEPDDWRPLTSVGASVQRYQELRQELQK